MRGKNDKKIEKKDKKKKLISEHKNNIASSFLFTGRKPKIAFV